MCTKLADWNITSHRALAHVDFFAYLYHLLLNIQIYQFLDHNFDLHYLISWNFTDFFRYLIKNLSFLDC